MKNPRELGEDEVRQYLLHLLEQQAASHSYVNQALRALKFLYTEVLRRSDINMEISHPKRERKLPEVLSKQEVIRLLEVVENPNLPRHYVIDLFGVTSSWRSGTFESAGH
jgi:site-specific recombinase XerD